MANMSTGQINTSLNNVPNGQAVIIQAGALKYLMTQLKTAQGSEAVIPYYQPVGGQPIDLIHLLGF